jgi:hypothetical protein
VSTPDQGQYHAPRKLLSTRRNLYSLENMERPHDRRRYGRDLYQKTPTTS